MAKAELVPGPNEGSGAEALWAILHCPPRALTGCCIGRETVGMEPTPMWNADTVGESLG